MGDWKPDGKKQKPCARTWWYILVTLFTGMLIISMAGFGWTLWRAKNENDDFAKLAQIAEAESGDSDAALRQDNSGTAQEPNTEAAAGKNYQALYDMNPDFIGWLKIDGTKVDYPVMYTPDDPQYYIYRDFQGRKTSSGTPFMDGNATLDSDSIILYGHNMKNDTMFGTLDRYQKKEYWEAHPVITFDTLEENREYEIFAVFTIRLFRQEEDGFRYYGYVGDLTEAQFNEFVSQSCMASHYDTGIIPEYGDQILMLSTCSYHTENGRLVVAARRRREDGNVIEKYTDR